MGSIKRKYDLLEFELDVRRRSVKETLKYRPVAKACSIAMDLVHLACTKIQSAVTERTEIDRESITQEMYKLMDEYVKFGMNKVFPDNLPGTVSFFCIPKIEGGDNYNLNHKEMNKDEKAVSDMIQIAVGINYKNYCCNYVRMLLINPTDITKCNYNLLLFLRRVLLYHLRDGAELCKVYETVISYAESKRQHLTKHLNKEIGFALSPIYEDDLIINSDSKAIAKCGMTFSINVNLMNLREGERVYNLYCSDTVLVRRDMPAELFTLFQRSIFHTVIDTNNQR